MAVMRLCGLIEQDSETSPGQLREFQQCVTPLAQSTQTELLSLQELCSDTPFLGEECVYKLVDFACNAMVSAKGPVLQVVLSYTDVCRLSANTEEAVISSLATAT
ncbi:hypothetical protein JZ751_029285 [Albula glossodonta]|uniref:Uncharacterized protein n=1 Tax=Albula glossodonta TaxID=121402 RepID=A0A8T2PHL8_9TELE|nr:hypothetical protein JZ751_029285 [Albula glossodonta]